MDFDAWRCCRNLPDFGQQRACREWLERNPQIKLNQFVGFGFHGQAFIVAACRYACEKVGRKCLKKNLGIFGFWVCLVPSEQHSRIAADDSNPIVSIIIPTYNRAEFIGDAIASVLRQSCQHFELIVIDDGSTDSTADVLNSFADARLIVVRQKNHGRSAARNKAFGLSRGRYIAFLDSDDLYIEHKLERQVAYMDRHPDVGMIYTSALCIDERGNLLKDNPYVASAEGNIYRQVAFFRPVTITLPTVMVRREVLESVGLFDEAMDRFEDTDLWRRIAKCYQIGVMAEPTCKLRTHADNSLRSQNPRCIIDAIEYYVAKIFRDDADVDAGFLHDGASRLYEYYGKAFISVSGSRRYGLSLLKKSILMQPQRFLSIVLQSLRVLGGSFMREHLTQHR